MEYYITQRIATLNATIQTVNTHLAYARSAAVVLQLTETAYQLHLLAAAALCSETPQQQQQQILQSIVALQTPNRLQSEVSVQSIAGTGVPGNGRDGNAGGNYQNTRQLEGRVTCMHPTMYYSTKNEMPKQECEMVEQLQQARLRAVGVEERDHQRTPSIAICLCAGNQGVGQSKAVLTNTNAQNSPEPNNNTRIRAGKSWGSSVKCGQL